MGHDDDKDDLTLPQPIGSPETAEEIQGEASHHCGGTDDVVPVVNSALTAAAAAADNNSAEITKEAASTPAHSSSEEELPSPSSSSNHNIKSFGNPARYHPPTPTNTLLPVTSINLLPPSVSSGDDHQTCASSITSAFRDADLFVSSLYPSTQGIDIVGTTQDYEEEPSHSHLMGGGSCNGMMGPPSKNEKESLSLSAAAATTTTKAIAVRDKRKKGYLFRENQDHNFQQSTSTTRQVEEHRHPQEGLEELGLFELSLLKPKAASTEDKDHFDTNQTGENSNINNLATAGNTPNTITHNATGTMNSQAEGGTFWRMMALPDRRTAREQQTPRGPGAHPISSTSAASGWIHNNRGSEYSNEESNQQQDTDFHNNNAASLDLVEAQPVDALPEAHVEEESSSNQERKKGQKSSLGFIAGCFGYDWRHLLMMLSAAILGYWFILYAIPQLVGARDPAIQRIRHSIEEAFGKDYFDSELKEKALHWIVHEDPLKDLTVKQDNMQEAEISSLIQRFSLVAFYFQTSATHPWIYCNPPQGKQSDVCFYRVALGKTEDRAARWLSAAHECQWMGVYCEGGSKSVSTLALSKNNMTGQIPSELAKLDKIKSLDISENDLSGSLPLWINQLSSIEKLYLNHNSFTGRIPTAYFSLPRLSELHLYSNLLNGPIPSQIGLFSGQSLRMSNNSLSGSIPNETYQLSNLQHLVIYQNRLTGTISTLIGQLTELRVLHMYNCREIGGTIPSQVGLLENLTYLNISMTKLGGTIPEELYNLRPMIMFDIRGTQLGGTISSGIGHLSELEECYLANTGVSGTIPEQLSLLSKLRIFHANANPKLTGSIPIKFCTNRYQHDDIVVDCSPSSSTGVPALICPKGCCSSCCDAETKICKEQ